MASRQSLRCWPTIISAARGSGSRIHCRRPTYATFARVDRDPLVRLVVAEQGGRVVGSLQVCMLPGLSSQGASRGLIEDVRGASDCRSRGIGEQLVQWAVAEARSNGRKLVELLTHHTRVDAQRFYERLGFARSHLGMTIRF